MYNSGSGTIFKNVVPFIALVISYIGTLAVSLVVRIYVIVITWARGVCLIYMPKPKGHRPKSKGIYIRQIPIAHAISNLYPSAWADQRNCQGGYLVYTPARRVDN